MKKFIISVFLSLFCLLCIAPGSGRKTELYIITDEPAYLYGLKDPFARAVVYCESRFDPYAVNSTSGARGIFQITKIMLDEVNKICRKEKIPKQYSWKDTFDPKKSIEMWYIVQNHKNPKYCYDKACRIWFGTGKQKDGMRWEDYYNLVMDRYYKQGGR